MDIMISSKGNIFMEEKNYIITTSHTNSLNI